MGSSVLAAGWATWNVNTNTALISYNESKTLKLDGTAYSTAQRVAWSNQLTDAVAATYILDTIFNNWKPCDVSPLFCSAWSPVIAVTNFKVVKGSAGVPSVFTWNPSWGINGVKYELLRSTDRINFSQTPIYQTTATTDTTNACKWRIGKYEYHGSVEWNDRWHVFGEHLTCEYRRGDREYARDRNDSIQSNSCFGTVDSLYVRHQQR
jgi:hypothetical protein